MSKVMNYISIIAMSIVLSTAGITITDWQWWACNACLILHGLTAVLNDMD